MSISRSHITCSLPFGEVITGRRNWGPKSCPGPDDDGTAGKGDEGTAVYGNDVYPDVRLAHGGDCHEDRH